MAGKLIEDISTIVQNPNADESTIIAQLRSLLDKVDTGERPGVVHAQPLADLYQKHFEFWCGEEGRTNVISSGLPGLDRATGGFRLGDYVVIGARPCMGKTQLMIDMALHMSKTIPVLFFSLDQSEFTFSAQLAATLAVLPTQALLNAPLASDMRAKLAGIGNDLQRRKLYTSCGSIRSLPAFVAYCQEEISSKGIKVIFVDGIQSFTLDGFRGNREAEVTMVSKELLRLSRDYKVLVIAASQLSRALEWRKESKMPLLSDLRDSGSIEQHADKVLLLYRPEYYGINNNEYGEKVEGETFVEVAKNRTGRRGSAKLSLKDNGGGFSDAEEDSRLFIPPVEEPGSFTFPRDRMPDWVYEDK